MYALHALNVLHETWTRPPCQPNAPDPVSPSTLDNHWILDGNIISKKFHAYRQACLERSKSASFTVEGNVNELLSMSGVLVLQKRYNYQSIPVEIFPPDLCDRCMLMSSIPTVVARSTHEFSRWWPLSKNTRMIKSTKKPQKLTCLAALGPPKRKGQLLMRLLH
ncbi:uncharacterized protein BYT42DRAFT_628147 [Radiomyces spectabilis]|uniref:uncharacterized protein n=1 Tax=Radiomyces spectabilis TaxID=64574 RepID=UPI00221EA551|nr:uncharacterized protein BYT42DRAFT_628147 [Radiomyces spectabilis]KAI8390966.1 hypothetical protein BYT42DRAFT_628147 [Radiomyces spectabilis]